MEYKIGDTFILEKIITKEVIQEFAALSGDYNPIHLDEEYAKALGFQKCIAHGMLGANYISSILGTEFPGIGTIYLEQNLKFKKPIYCGEKITIVVELKELLENHQAIYITNILNADNEIASAGEALVKLPCKS